MRIIILDPGLTGRVGHHYEFNRALIEHARRHGIAAALVGHKDCDAALAAELGVVRGFSLPPYLTHAGPPEFVAPWRWMRLSEGIEQDLDRLSFPALTPADRILLHTAHSGHINGLYRWYARLGPSRPGVCLQMMFPPAFQTAPEDGEVATALLKRALRPWTAIADTPVCLASDNQELAAHLQDLLAHPVATLPMPIALAPGGAAQPPDGPVQLAYVGEGRLEKGFPALVDALFRHASRLSGLRLALHTGRSGAGTQLGEALRALPHVELIDRPLDQRAYHDLLQRSAAVLLPYEAGAYAMRSSRVFAEALSLGKPVLVTAGTWMERELTRWERSVGALAGVRVQPDARDGLIAAIMELVERLPALAAAAAALSPAYRQANSPAAFWEAAFPGMPSNKKGGADNTASYSLGS